MNLEIWSSSSGLSHHLRSFLPIWSAKNVRNDEYNLKQPIWISDLHFLDEQHRPLDLGFLVAVCTRFHQVHSVIWSLLISIGSCVRYPNFTKTNREHRNRLLSTCLNGVGSE